MVAGIAETATTIGLTSVKWLGIGLLAIVIIAAIIVTIVLTYKRKRWNLKLTIKLPRSDGKIILTDKGKGYWDAENGWIMVKRKGYKGVPSRPIDPKKWLQGRDSATLIQVGPQDFIVALEDSYTVLTDENGKQYALMDIIADIGKRKTWKNYTERQGKKTFTLRGWLENHQFAVAIAIVMFTMFIGFAILWMRMPSICGK